MDGKIDGDRYKIVYNQLKNNAVIHYYIPKIDI